jgi:hypothetical protein
MRSPTGQIGRSTIVFPLLVGLLVGQGVAARAEPPRTRTTITVNSPLGRAGAEPGRTTLPDALAAAARDPRDNVIRFDPAVFRAGGTVIHISTPLVVDSKDAGSDRILGETGIVVDASNCTDAGIVVGGDARLTISHLTIRGGQRRIILVQDTGRLQLESVTLVNGVAPGLGLFGDASATLLDCQLQGNGTHGIELHGRSSATLKTTALVDNAQSGLAAFDSATVNLEACRIEGNGQWGLVLATGSRANLARCALARSRFAAADLSGTSQLTCVDCTIDSSDRFGVFATGSAGLNLRGTRIHRSGSRGIELQDTSSLVMSDTRVEASGEYGLIAFGAARASVTGSFFSGSGAHGASFRGKAAGQFTGCAFTSNRYSGLGCLDARDGGDVRVSQSVFRQNGMRPLYRGPLHIDPLVPTPLHVDSRLVECLTEPGATVELFLDRRGEAGQYLRTIRADGRGRFQVDCREIPEGYVMTAAATGISGTSEFNVVGGSASATLLGALLGRTGPLSDDGGDQNLDTLLRRWRPNTRIVLALEHSPSPAVERYVRYLVQRIADWTQGTILAEVVIGPVTRATNAVVIPIRYVPSETPQLLGRGGVTFMRWDSSGYFQSPMEIMLAIAPDPLESCPRVLAHEVGHALGLCHTRVGLLSRMQGAAPPTAAYVNDFAPTMTFYDVLALQALHDPQITTGITLRQLLERGTLAEAYGSELARMTAAAEPSFSPPANDKLKDPRPQGTQPQPQPAK